MDFAKERDVDAPCSIRRAGGQDAPMLTPAKSRSSLVVVLPFEVSFSSASSSIRDAQGRPFGADRSTDPVLWPDASFEWVWTRPLLCPCVGMQLSGLNTSDLRNVLDMVEWSEPLIEFQQKHFAWRGTPALQELSGTTFGDLRGLAGADLPILVELAVTLEAAIHIFTERGIDPFSQTHTAESEGLSVDDCWLALWQGGQGARPDWATFLTASDPRFASMLTPALSVDHLVSQAMIDNDWLAVERLRSIGSQVQRMLRTTVEQESIDLFEALSRQQRRPLDARWLRAISMRLGIAGYERVTLDDVGRFAGVTRERVRQVESKVKEWIVSARTLWMPQLDQAIELTQSLMPVSSDGLKAILQDAELVNAGTTLTALQSIAEFAGRSAPWSADSVISTDEDRGLVTAIARSAKAVANANGIGSIELLVERLPGRVTPFAMDLVRVALDQTQGLHWLDEQHFWVEHPAGRNRIVNLSQRVLSVHSPQTISSLQEAVRRTFTWRSATGADTPLREPSRDVLRLFYVSHPAFDVDGDTVTSLLPLTNVKLGDEKSILVEILRAAPHPALDRAQLVRQCREAGMSAGTIGVYTTYAEILERVSDGVWALRGVPIPESYVSTLKVDAKERRDAFEKRLETGVTQTGRPWMCQRLTESVTQSSVLGWNFHREQLRGNEFRIIDAEDGEELGWSKFSKGFNYGYGRVLQKYSAKEGDCIRLTFFIAEGYVLAEIGNEELMEAPADLG